MMVTGVMSHAKPISICGDYSFGLPEDSRTIRWGNIIEAVGGGPSARATFAISFSAASRPISRIGWRIVVNDGHNREANGLSSKPITVRSSGILRPRKYAVR